MLTHKLTNVSGIEWVLFGWIILPPCYPLAFLFLLPLTSPKPFLSPQLKWLLASCLYFTFLLNQLASLPSSMVWQLFFCSFPSFLPLPCPDTNFHTQIQGNVRNVFAPAASCCCCTYDCNPRTWGVWAFIQSPWMDGWMDAGVEWLMKKWGSVGPPLQNSLHNPKTNNNMLIQQGKFSFFLFFYLLRVSQQHPHISCENRSIMIHSYTQTFFKNWQ